MSIVYLVHVSINYMEIYVKFLVKYCVSHHVHVLIFFNSLQICVPP